MSILVTGGAGTLGLDFLDFWIANKISDTLILIDKVDESIVKNQINNEENIHYFRVDLLEYEKLEDIIRHFKPKVIVHCASSMEDGNSGFESNVLTAINLITASNKNGRPKIFFPQSFLTRDTSIEVTDNAPIAADLSGYSLFKAIAETYIRTYEGEYVIGILGTSVSPRLSIGPIPAFTKRITTGLEVSISDTYRDYLTPSDVIDAILLCCNSSLGVNIIAIGSGNPIHTKDVYNMVRQALSLPQIKVTELVSPNDSDPHLVKIVPSGKLIELGWKYQLDITRAILNSVKYAQMSDITIRQHHR